MLGGCCCPGGGGNPCPGGGGKPLMLLLLWLAVAPVLLLLYSAVESCGPPSSLMSFDHHVVGAPFIPGTKMTILLSVQIGQCPSGRHFINYQFSVRIGQILTDANNEAERSVRMNSRLMTYSTYCIALSLLFRLSSTRVFHFKPMRKARWSTKRLEMCCAGRQKQGAEI